MSEQDKKTARDLVAQALSAPLPSVGAAGTPPPADPASATDDEVAEWIDLYFTLDDPLERDALFERVAAAKAPLAVAFLQAMREHDEDEYLRAAAAAELARRGDPEAVAALEDELDNPSELYFFSQAVAVLAEVHGAAFYQRLTHIWHDATRDPAERREAMLGLERIDEARALEDYLQFMAHVQPSADMPDDQMDAAMAAFARHACVRALPVLTALHQRIVAASWSDPQEAQEAADFVAEGIALLSED